MIKRCNYRTLDDSYKIKFNSRLYSVFGIWFTVLPNKNINVKPDMIRREEKTSDAKGSPQNRPGANRPISSVVFCAVSNSETSFPVAGPWVMPIMAWPVAMIKFFTEG